MHLFIAPSVRLDLSCNNKLYAKTFSTKPHNHNKGTPMILLVASNKDIASLNIKNQILNNYEFHKTEVFQGNPTYKADVNGKKVILATLNEESIMAQYLTDKFPTANLIVFISRHSSQSSKPTLSVHTPGNFGNAEYGGLPKALDFPCSGYAKCLKSVHAPQRNVKP
jgi:D-tyrosyl-tRNA(Tyr) deacylase